MFWDKQPLHYRRQRSCGQGYVFTRVCHSVNRRVSASVHAGIPHPRVDSPRADSPPEQTPPSRADTLLGADTPPPGVDTPPGSRLRHTVNERPVRILLECILLDCKNALAFYFRYLIKHVENLHRSMRPRKFTTAL